MIERGEHDDTDLDTNLAHVIVAKNEADVEELAAQNARDEGRDIWLKNSTIKLLGTYTGSEDSSHVVLTSTLDG